MSAPIQALMVQVSAFSASAGPSGLCRLGMSVSPVFFFFFALDSEVVITLEMSMCFLLKRGGKKAEGRKKSLIFLVGGNINYTSLCPSLSIPQQK